MTYENPPPLSHVLNLHSEIRLPCLQPRARAESEQKSETGQRHQIKKGAGYLTLTSVTYALSQ